MRAIPSIPLVLLQLLFISSLVASQSNNATVTVFTSFFISTGFGPNRQPTTATSSLVVTSTITPSSNNGNSTNSGNSTSSNNGNSTSTANSTTSSTSTSNLPTAPTTVIAGGISGVAPVPGASGGAYGPPDGYVAGATALKRNALLVGLVGCIIGGALVLL